MPEYTIQKGQGTRTMAGYDRQIAYIHTLQAGEAGRNIGFLKWESDQTIHRMEIHIKGLYETDSGMVDMRTEEGLLFDQISFEKGHADYRKKCRVRFLERRISHWKNSIH